MADYLFRVFRDDDTVLAERACTLNARGEAGVISFGLLRELPDATLVVVTCGGQEVARRTRIGGKSMLVWRRLEHRSKVG